MKISNETSVISNYNKKCNIITESRLQFVCDDARVIIYLEYECYLVDDLPLEPLIIDRTSNAIVQLYEKRVWRIVTRDTLVAGMSNSADVTRTSITVGFSSRRSVTIMRNINICHAFASDIPLSFSLSLSLSTNISSHMQYSMIRIKYNHLTNSQKVY